ncbi:hypothetical protein NPIL_643811 [Nephila pilipes]|uniref:Uncharacterized protein n=1 Tax=Nephila pilipes TaxID=299642 RepID=A0A8X6JLS2_NEPPI|nr:hypothetical protein NPIL_643811 [Nephila pilipes]
MKEEVTALGRSYQRKERILTNIDLSLKFMQSYAERCLSSDVQQNLLSQLSVTDQEEIDQLNYDFRKLTHGTKEALHEGMMLEAEKNKLTYLLNNHLHRKEKLETPFQ